MKIPFNVIANADDLGLNPIVNKAILCCYQNNYINSTSLLTNTVYFDETACFIHQNPIINNIGVHVNFAEDRPLTAFNQFNYLSNDGTWNIQQTNKKLNYLSTAAKIAFKKEICAQIDKALAAKIKITHLDSHYHLHTLPCFYQLFLQAAKNYNLKLRLAQTYNEGSLVKYAYRKYINRILKTNHIQYADRFETVARYLATVNDNKITGSIEIMLHPDFDNEGNLTDHYDVATITQWINFLKQN